VYGSEGTISGPDPNTFGGPVGLWRQGSGAWNDVSLPPVEHRSRGIGLADMVRATSERRPHRASGELGYHVLDAMCALLESAEQGRYVEIGSSCARPAAF
jgi:predicted dehydrogenase